MRLKKNPLEFYPQFVRFIGPTAIRWAIIASVASLALTVVEVAIAGAIQLLLVSLGAVSANADLPAFLQGLPKSTTFVGYLLIVIAALRAVFQLLQGYGNFMTRESVLYRLRVTLLQEMLGPNSSFVRTAEVQTRLSEVFPKAAICAYYVVNGLISILQTVGLGAALFWLSLRDSFVALAGVALVGAATRYSSYKLRALAAVMPQAQMRLNEGLNRIARNWLYVKIMRTEPREYDALKSEINAYNAASIRGVYLTNANGAVAPFLGVLLIVVIVYLSQNVWNTPGIQIIAFLYMLVRFINSLTLAVNAISAVSLNEPQLFEAMKYTQGKPLDAADLISVKSFPTSSVSVPFPANHTPPSIRFEGVGMRFDDDGPFVLKDLSLTVASGEQLGILGPSGSGKTTVLNVLLGIISPTEGQTLIGDKPAKLVFDEGRYRIGYVGPNPLLIEGTLRENLLYGNRSAVSDDDLWKALSKAKLEDRIRQLHQQLDQHLNEHADILSAGQKQRLAMARALAMSPDILILDEASANLDEQTESEITQTILQLKGTCTTVIVSHRPGILKHVDKLLDLSAKITSVRQPTMHKS